jgi:hypothetical protein
MDRDSVHDASRSARVQRAFGKVLFALALAIVGYRFINRDLFPFVLDEPSFLETARNQLRSGYWVSASPLVGNQGVHYGPTVLWLYGLIHLLLGPRPEVHATVMALLVGLANVTVAVACGRRFGDRWVVPAAVLALVASSPYQFFWSRLAWDQSVDICTSFAVALLCRRGDLSRRRAIAIGVLLGLGVSSHLMIVPLTIALFGFAVLSSAPGRRLARAALVGGSVLVVNLPYLSYLAVHSPPPTGTTGIAWSMIPAFLVEPVRVASMAKITYFLESDWSAFARVAPSWAEAVELSDRLNPWLAGLIAVALLLTLLKSSSTLRRRFAGLGLVVWLGYALFYSSRYLADHPHYQWPIWWIVPLAVAAGLHLLRRRLKAIRLVALGLVWAAALTQTMFLVRWTQFVRAQAGTRGPHFGTVISEQRRVVRTACSREAGKLWLRAEATPYPESLSYLASIEPKCAGKEVVVKRSFEQPSPEVLLLSVVYAGPDSAHLTLQ